MSMYRRSRASKRTRLAICLVAGFALTASSALAATLTTDRSDYAPGETVTFSGSGWQPGEWVIIALDETPQTHDTEYVLSTADEAGNILNTQYAPDPDDLGVSYTATAHGMLSLLSAVAVFTDGPPVSGALCAGASVCPGTTSLSVYNPTHYALPVGSMATVAIVGASDLTGTETCNSSPGVEVIIKSTPLGNTTICGTLSNCPGDNCTVTFDYTAPANGCQTTNVAYKTNGNGATNDVIDDGLLNGSASAAAGLAYVKAAGDNAAVSCAAVSTTIHDADHNPVVLVAPGTVVHDKVTVTAPSGQPVPTGIVTLRWFANDNCSGAAASTSPVLPLSGGMIDATSFSQTAANAGFYSFQASYSGDGNYDPAVGPCELLEVQEQEIIHSGNIRACKYEDLAANGQLDDGDPPLSGWEMTLLDSDDNPVGDPQTTGNDGCTEFTGLLPGDYTVDETQQSGWFNTDPGNAGAPCLADDCPTPSKPATVVADQTTSVQFGNIQGCTLDVCKYEDSNANGVRDDGEPPLSGWNMTVEGVGSALTEGEGGCASFVVLPGTYTASEDLQSGPPPWFNTDPGKDDAPCLPGACPNPSRSAACTTAGGSASVAFGNIQSAEKHGHKFYDANADGTDNDSQSVAGITITLSGTAVNGAAVTQVTQTDGSGNYQFLNLLPGSYTVTETLPNQSWLNTTPKTIPFVLDPGEVELHNDFGNLCVGGGGGLTLGFWSNKNGQASMTGGLGGINGALLFLSNLNLRNANGTNSDPASYTAFRTWILGATATNMAYMLSAQLAAMELNVRQGFVSGGAILSVGTAPAGCSVPAFVSVNSLMSAANASLLVNPNTTASSPVRSCQEFMKTALDRGNNNLNFVQSRPCRF